MNPKAKAAVTIVLNFTVGILIGALWNGTYVQSRVRTVSVTTPELFVREMERVIQVNSTQHDEVSTILLKRSKEVAALREHHILEMRVIVDSLHADLASVLTPDQLKRLNQRFQDWQSPPYGKFMAGFITQHLTSRLDLSEEQTKRIQAIFEESGMLMKEQWEDSRREPASFRAPPWDYPMELRKKIGAVLTDRQRKIFANIAEEGPFFPRPRFRGLLDSISR